MDYHGQPLQFISSYFLQAQHLDHGIYPNIINLLYTIIQFSLIGTPFIGYLTIKYIHPKICNYVEWYSKYLKQNRMLSNVIINLILFFSFVIINLIITILLMTAHILSIMRFTDYSYAVLGDVDRNLPYIHSIFSGFAILTMFAIALFLVYIYGITMCFIIATFTSVNIIYISSYFGPFMFLALIHVPLLIITFIFISAATVIVWCLLTNSFFIFVTSGIPLNTPLWFWFTYAIVMYIIKIILILIFLYALALIVTIVIHSFFLGSFSDSPSLAAVVIAILVALIGTVVFKSAYKKFKEMHRQRKMEN